MTKDYYTIFPKRKEICNNIDYLRNNKKIQL